MEENLNTLARSISNEKAFSLYSQLAFKSIDFESLAQDDEVFASVEYSGCEGFYIEVAKFKVVDGRSRPFRYAFLKVFEEREAVLIANYINGGNRFSVGLIHDLDC